MSLFFQKFKTNQSLYVDNPYLLADSCISLIYTVYLPALSR